MTTKKRKKASPQAMPEKPAETPGTAREWRTAPPVTDLEVAFPTTLDGIAPPESDWPADVKNGTSPLLGMASTLFAQGGAVLKGASLRDGIELVNVIRALQATLGSWHYKHEHKLSQVATMLGAWFTEIPLANWKAP